ncbi:cupin domain-containing protein [Candidatus Saccharibacteria bacterium]|nr:MAG: cupin domain-containing protein [Candidatus Saccharibacteria bacterium]
MMTHGYMPAGGMYDWHEHPGVEEIMVVVKGTGLVHDEDGEYGYEAGDVFIFRPTHSTKYQTQQTKKMNLYSSGSKYD